jgi:Domain of unknown function (DUF4304)
MSAQDAYDEMVRELIWPFLRARAFKRSGTTFHRPDRANWQVISLQKSVYSSADEIRFTVNIAVALDRLREGVHDWPEGKRPRESRCHLRVRIGGLLGTGDTWWRLAPDTNIVTLADTVDTAIDTYALPWLDAHSDEDRLLALMRDPEELERQRHDFLHWAAKLAKQVDDDELYAKIEATRSRQAADMARRC